MIIGLKHFKQDTNYSCGPATVQMLLAHFGIKKSEADLVKELGTDRSNGTENEAIVAEIMRHGLNCKTSTGASLSEIKFYVKHNLPVLVNYIEPERDDGHFALVVGYGWWRIYLHDPWHGPNFRMSKREFLSRWKDGRNIMFRWLLVASDRPLPRYKLKK